ncbi:MAG: hypothetical protein ABR549_11315 [Mycobacteriales bacterium]
MRTREAERQGTTEAPRDPWSERPKHRSWLADLLDSAVDSYALVLGVGYASKLQD